VTPMMRNSAAARFRRLFRKAGILLAQGRQREALTVLREGETLARALGDEEKAALFREEITRCEKSPCEQ
jgi:hypothetical protein